ncbi:MAG: kelch repeat-containing protein [Planctomycetota bacterium]
MHPIRTIELAAVAALLAVHVPAQNLELDVTGGTLPGTVTLDTYPGLVPFELVVIVPSTSSGPTPCSLFDPLDPRSLSIGLDLVGSAFAGLTDPFTGHFVLQFPIAGPASLHDLPLFFQSVTLLWAPTLLDRISNGNVIRLGGSNTFRDRLISSQYDRAFATVLPRPDHKWLLVAGARGQLLAQQAWSTSEIYDPIADAFTPGPSLTAPRSMHSATLLPNGKWLIAGGVNATNDPQATCEVYDPVLDTFTAVAAMGTPRMGHTATLLGNGKVLVTGGIQAMPTTPTQLEPIHQAVNTTELYDPVANTWTAGPNLSTPRAAHMALSRPDGKVALVGGISWDNLFITWLPAVRRTMDLYDPVANTMAAGPLMATARSLIDPLPLGNNRWLFAGGISALTLTSQGTPTNTAEIYDAVANTWTTVGSMATARGNHKGWAISGTQYLLAGGANGTVLAPNALSSSEIFSTTTNTFSPGPNMNQARAGAAMFATPQGQVQLFGGATTGGVITATTEWYYF